jgi:enoyl-CoA hydratase/carnithine racemase
MGQEFKSIMKELNTTDTRALILTGNGRAFSAGGDLDWLQQRTTQTPFENAKTMSSFYGLYLKSVLKTPFPVIAAVNGHAVGAGACLSLACDIRIASTNAKYGFNFVNLGIPPGMGGSYTLPILVGLQNASRLMLTGEIIDAKEAKELGLVLDVVEDAHEAALVLARKIALASPVAVQATTKTLRMRLSDGALDRAIQREADTQAICFSSSDIKEGLLAVREKRKPKF